MINFGRAKNSLFQVAREADRDTLHALARDSVYRRRLGILANKKDGGQASQAASAIAASFRTAGQLIENGEPKPTFDKSVALFFFIHDVPGTADHLEAALLVERAQNASVYRGGFSGFFPETFSPLREEVVFCFGIINSSVGVYY